MDMSAPPAGDVTGLLLQWNEGKLQAREELIPRVYRELRALASRSLGRDSGEQTLQPTALVHELYQKLVDQRRVQWKNRAHFFALASELMRRILVDHARRRRAWRRGGRSTAVTLSEATLGISSGPDVDLIALDDALTGLSTLDAGQARIVELRFFGGLTIEETAEALGISPATVKREWATARLCSTAPLTGPATNSRRSSC